MRASLAMQRQYNVGLNSNQPGTISLAVDRNRYPRLGPRGPERAWPGGDTELCRNRRQLLDGSPSRGIFGNRNQNKLQLQPGGSASHLQLPPPRYSPAYTSDVSHLVV